MKHGNELLHNIYTIFRVFQKQTNCTYNDCSFWNVRTM